MCGHRPVGVKAVWLNKELIQDFTPPAVEALKVPRDQSITKKEEPRRERRGSAVALFKVIKRGIVYVTARLPRGFYRLRTKTVLPC